jgi:aromatic-amino-acid transaminase
MSILQTVEKAPPDPILGLTTAFKADPNPNKVNLGVGVYKDENGNTPILACVKKAEEKILQNDSRDGYLPIEGSPEYAAAVQELLFGADSPIVAEKRVATAHAPGGTGALRLAADFLKKVAPNARMWVSDPTWVQPGHSVGAPGIEIDTYPYYDADGKCLDIEAMLAGLERIPAGDIVLLHGCCHNPSGMDPDADQWRRIAKVMADGDLLPLIDFAYQGLANGIEKDNEGMRIVVDACGEALIASSFSKNFGLYCERVGALTLVSKTAQATAASLTQIQASARANYSNPPFHGAAIVCAVLADPDLRAEWEREVAEIRNRIKQMRVQLVETLKAKGVERDFSFITTQNGMFSFSGLTKDQVQKLRDENGIYIVGSGRINVAALTPANMDGVCEAIAAVL